MLNRTKVKTSIYPRKGRISTRDRRKCCKEKKGKSFFNTNVLNNCT